ncbi:MAG: Gfo/Idh/MocA family oxidoreductase [Opitutus sp.]|nr:Gfo/Idh/MocA family oxidoreductase [Opitutus sp.]
MTSAPAPLPSTPVRFAAVSPGRWGRKLLDAAKASPLLAFAGVFSRSPQNREEIVRDFGGVNYPSYEALLADTAVEAVVLPTPHFLHHSQTLAALRAGKHVFVEKPVATTLAQAEEMLKVGQETGRVLAVGHQGRHTGGIKKVKAMLAAGELGHVATVVIVQGYPHALFRPADDWRTGENAVPGGQLDELGVHYFDVLHFLFGPVRRVTGFVQRPGASLPPETATVAMHFDGGLIASYTTYATSVGSSRMTIFGSKGALELNRMGQDACTWQPVADLATTRLGGLPAQPIKFEGPYLITTALTAELEDFAGAIREGRRPQVGAAESLATLRISRAVMEASATGRTVEL